MGQKYNSWIIFCHLPAGSVPQAEYSFPAKQESKPNSWINTSFVLYQNLSQETESRNGSNFFGESRFWIRTGTEDCPFSLSGSEIWALTPSFASSPDLFSVLISVSSRTNRDNPTLQAAYFGVELLWLLYQCIHLPNTLLPCTSRPALPPCPWETLTVLWGQCWGPSEAGAIPSVQTGRALVLFVPQLPLIVGCSGSRLPHDSLADVLSLNK